MIDFQDMNKRQQEGLVAIESLQEQETSVLRHYCSMATEALLTESSHRKSSVDQVVINAYKYGIALGIQLKVVKGEIRGREYPG